MVVVAVGVPELTSGGWERVGVLWTAGTLGAEEEEHGSIHQSKLCPFRSVSPRQERFTKTCCAFISAAVKWG